LYRSQPRRATAVDASGKSLLCILGTKRDSPIVSVAYFYFVKLFVGEKKSKFDVKFDDRSVCKSFLLGCCPHDILSATVCTAYYHIDAKI